LLGWIIGHIVGQALTHNNARLEVPEIWCYDEGVLKIYHLQDGDYIEAETSLALPQLPVQELPQLIEAHRARGRRAIRKAVRDWARGYRET
jgi:hypothetical protein